MIGVYPCLETFSGIYHPVCRVLTHEEDGFQSQQAIIEAADTGNHFCIFSSTSDIPTYGFAVQGCPEDYGNLFSYFTEPCNCMLPSDNSLWLTTLADYTKWQLCIIQKWWVISTLFGYVSLSSECISQNFDIEENKVSIIVTVLWYVIGFTVCFIDYSIILTPNTELELTVCV